MDLINTFTLYGTFATVVLLSLCSVGLVIAGIYLLVRDFSEEEEYSIVFDSKDEMEKWLKGSESK